MKYVRDSKAAGSLSAWVIMKGARHVATVQMHHGGTTVANIWQEPEAYRRSFAAIGGDKSDDRAAYDAMQFQRGTAAGGGYDKRGASLVGLYIDGHRFSDHASSTGAPKPPNGKKFYPADFTPPAGYSLANYGTYDRATGERRHRYYWKDAARAELGDAADWDAITARAREIEAAADLESGYDSCFRHAGLRYLEERGYRVLQAI